ncbi:MAG TPA: TdeIII family type II restriction endonuclease [Candidatus Tripitaka sp. YC43]
MNNNTVQELRKAVWDFLDEIESIKPDLSKIEKAYPFHVIFFSPEAILASKIERSTVTKMGQIFHPKIAEIIAKDRYKDVHRNYRIEGKLDSRAIQIIEQIAAELRDGKREPNHDKEFEEIFSAKSGNEKLAHVIADLYVGDFKEGPLFFEIKSPLPNLDICYATKRKIFLFLSLLRTKHPKAYFAFPYNPYVTREKYGWSFTKQIMDIDKQVLMGEEMWDKLGGFGTFDSMIRIMKDAADRYRKKSK